MAGIRIHKVRGDRETGRSTNNLFVPCFYFTTEALGRLASRHYSRRRRRAGGGGGWPCWETKPQLTTPVYVGERPLDGKISEGNFYAATRSKQV